MLRASVGSLDAHLHRPAVARERDPRAADLHAERLVGDGRVALLELVHVLVQRGAVDGPMRSPC
eukprot:5407197-Pyramimonas_sp.AAC.1